MAILPTVHSPSNQHYNKNNSSSYESSTRNNMNTYNHPKRFPRRFSDYSSTNGSIDSNSSSSHSSTSSTRSPPVHQQHYPRTSQQLLQQQQPRVVHYAPFAQNYVAPAPANYAPSSFNHSYRKPVMPSKGMYIGMDCEMVGVTNPDGSTSSVCARVVLIDWKGRIVLDSYVQPSRPVTDYRTFVSGITAEQLEGAPSFASVRVRVQELVHNRILVGHGLENDLGALKMNHPWWMTRDTAYYQPFMREISHNKTHVPRKLKDLCRSKLNREIQILGKSHCPAEDARAALDLYKSHRPRWEACLASHVQQLNAANSWKQAAAQQPAYYYPRGY